MGIDPQQALQLAAAQTRAAWWQVGAAIAQAVISGGAIWAAGVIASRQRRAESLVREEQQGDLARDLAMVHARAFRAWNDRSLQIAAILDQGELGAINILQLVSGDEQFLQPPLSIRGLVGCLRDFGPAARSVQRAFIATERFREARPQMVAAGLEVAAHRTNAVELQKAARLARACVEAIPEASRQVNALLE